MKRNPLYLCLMLLGICCLWQCGGSDQAETPDSAEKTAPTRGITDDEILIGSWGPQTGPAALWGAVSRGAEIYFKMINDEGGINGRKVRFIHRDDGYQPPRTKAAVKEMLERQGVFAFVCGVGTAPGMAVKDYLVENKVPWISPSSGSSHWAFPPHENIFATYPLYSDEAAILADYAVTELGKKKIAFFYQNDDYGKGGLYGAKLALQKHGLDFVATASVEVMDTDLNSQVLKLREAGADVVISWVLPKQAQILLSTSSKLGFNAQFMTSSTLSDVALMHELTKGKWEDVIFTSFGLMDDTTPTYEKYKAAAAKYAPNERWGPFLSSGFLNCEPVVAALKACGRDITYERFIAEMEKLENFESSGAPLTFGPDIRQGRRSVRLYKCGPGGMPVRLSDWRESNIDIEEAIRLLKEGH